MAGNPYKTTEFVSKIHVWLQDVDPDRLRRLVQKEGLISFDQLERLRKIQDQKGTAEHNAQLISILCPGETKSYQVLCSVIHQMGYFDRHLEMLRIVANPEQELLSSVGQPESANTIATSADPTVIMPTEDHPTAAAPSSGYAAYQSTPGTTSTSPLGQQVAPLCPPMKSRTAAARRGAEGGEAAGATAATTIAAAAAAAGAMAGAAATAAVAMEGALAVTSSATVLTPQASLQARLPIGTAMPERAHGATAESELGATATVSAVPALHHCHYSGAQPPIALQPGAALACSSTGRSPSSMSGPSTTAETTFGLSQTCMSAPTQATPTHPIASSANTSTGSFTADGNAARRGTAMQQSTQQPASVHLENTAQLAAAAVVFSSLPLEPQAKRALLSNVGRAFTEEMSRHIDYVSAPSMAHTSPDSQASLLQKSQFLLDSPEMSESDSRFSGSAASSDTEGWTKDDLRNARVTVFVDSKLRTSADCDGIILDSLSKQHFNETNIRIKSTSRRSDPALTSVEGKGGDIRTLVKIIINGKPDDYTKHRIQREVIEDLEDLTFSKNQIQVIYKGDWDSIQVVLLLPMRTLGHLLYLAVHYPGLLRGLDILQIIDISSLTIIDFREITGSVVLDELADDNEDLSEDDDEDEDESEINELEFLKRTNMADIAEYHISQREYDLLNNRSTGFQSVLAAIMRSHRKDKNFMRAISAGIGNKMPSSKTQNLIALTHRRKKELAAFQDGLLTSPERIESLTTELKQSSFELHDEEEEVTMSPAKMPRKTWLPPEQRMKMSDDLLSASRQGDLKKIAALLESGADVNCCSRDWRGDTPLHDAARRGNLEVCQALIAGGADCNIKNERGDTPLHDAARRGNLEVCQALIAGGADCYIKNQNGITPLDRARFWKLHAVVELLEKATPKTS
ncbi:streptococcal hemagglutinin-like [Sycon ciliatum]|uniref:streptococcal hemagglutinin-like n=1 Tax=Sycon ciliatum TaxID=27933 RepID=UPI0031F68394